MEPKKQIVVQSYLDANQFLQDFYEFQKKLDPKFSYEVWAKNMGLKSKSYLRFAVLGERGISPELTQALSEYLQLDGSAKEYFSVLVLYTQSKQIDQKRILGRRLTQLMKEDIQFAEMKVASAVMANPLGMVVRNILSFSDIPRTADFLAQLLGISEQEVSGILRDLEQEELIRAEGPSWVATEKRVRLADKTDAETQLYHKLCLEKAIEAQSKPVQERHFRGVGIALSEEEYQSYLEDLNIFVKNIFAKYDSDELRNRRVYQINFSLFPWTSPVPEMSSPE